MSCGRFYVIAFSRTSTEYSTKFKSDFFFCWMGVGGGWWMVAGERVKTLLADFVWEVAVGCLAPTGL